MGYLSSASTSGLIGFLTKGVGSKLIFYVVCIWLLAAAFNILRTLLPEVIPSDWWTAYPVEAFYFINYFMLPQLLMVRMGALTARWLTRRIPVIGG